MHVFLRGSFQVENPRDRARTCKLHWKALFADPTQGAGTDGVELGTRRTVPHYSPAGIKPKDLPAGEVFGRSPIQGLTGTSPA